MSARAANNIKIAGRTKQSPSPFDIIDYPWMGETFVITTQHLNVSENLPVLSLTFLLQIHEDFKLII